MEITCIMAIWHPGPIYALTSLREGVRNIGVTSPKITLECTTWNTRQNLSRGGGKPIWKRSVLPSEACFYTGRIVLLLCINNYAPPHTCYTSFNYSAYAVYTILCICSVSTWTLIYVWCIHQWVLYMQHMLDKVCRVCVTNMWHILHGVYVQ